MKFVVALSLVICLWYILLEPNSPQNQNVITGSATESKQNNIIQSTRLGREIGAVSNPLSDYGDANCRYNQEILLNEPSIHRVTIIPHGSWSFNRATGDPGTIPYRSAFGVPAGCWCNLAAHFAKVANDLGLIVQFQDHGVGDLGQGPEYSVLIWNTNGQDGEADLVIINNTDRIIEMVWNKETERLEGYVLDT